MEQGKIFAPTFQRSPTKEPFWEDVNVQGNNKVNNIKKESTSAVIEMNTSIQHVPELTDDTSPSIPLAQTQALRTT